MARYSKLVRDGIPAIIAAEGRTAKTHVAGPEEYKEKLLKKLQEEARECAEAPSLEELADLCEVIGAVQELYGWTDAQLTTVQAAKRADRGGFAERLILEEIHG